jgi:hypothetical protein
MVSAWLGPRWSQEANGISAEGRAKRVMPDRLLTPPWPQLALVAMGRESGEDGKADRVMSELVFGEIKVLRVNELRWDGFLQRIGRTAAASTCYSHMNAIEQCIILYS